jgi:microcystin-dependent protein
MEVDMNRPICRIAFFAALALAPLADASACSLTAYMGSVCATAANQCPKGMLPADGRLLPIIGNEALFSLLGVTYGGNAKTTFALPDLRGRIVAHAGQGPGLAKLNLGDSFGSDSVQIGVANMGIHNHPATSTVTLSAKLRGQSAVANSTEPASNVPAKFATATNGYTNLPADVDMDASAIKASAKVTTTLEPAGSGAPIDKAQPTLVMTYCVATSSSYNYPSFP